MDRKAEFKRRYPDAFYLEVGGDPRALRDYLLARGWLAPGQQVTGIGKAGEGNMNCTLRVHTSHGSLIVKQARPWVEKYEQIPAPVDRLLTEFRFYEAVAGVPAVASRMPKLVGYDPVARAICLEDLGAAGDLMPIYREGRLSADELCELLDYLVALHGIGEKELRDFPENLAMRELNHEHLFRFPLKRDNGLDLDAITPGLSAAAEELKGDRAYLSRVAELGERYLGAGRILLHGDYYPGSWLRARQGLRVIDPEFGFLGPGEVDLGIFLGHLHLSGHPPEEARALVRQYTSRRPLDEKLAWGYAGVEIMRRLIGVAQLPLSAGLDRKQDLLRLSRSFLLPA